MLKIKFFLIISILLQSETFFYNYKLLCSYFYSSLRDDNGRYM